MKKLLFHGRVKLVAHDVVRHYVLTAVSAKAAHQRLGRMLQHAGCDLRDYQIICQQVYSNLYSVAHTEYDTENIFG